MGAFAIVAQEPAAEHVGRARSGDLAAYEALYRAHVRRIYSLCLRMSGDPTRAEEATQEAFVRAWERLGTLRSNGDFRAWLTRVAVNVVLGERRSRRRRPERGWDEPDAPEQLSAGPAPVPGRSLDLEAAISRLPAGARTVFVLHDVEGYRHDEIAALLDVTPGTTKAQLHRARRLLREALRS